MPEGNIFRKLSKDKKRLLRIFFALLLIWYYFSLPEILFREPLSTVLESKEGTLLGARIAGDMQWRFPAIKNLPWKYKKCLIAFEDRYFYYHPGFNPVSIIEAMYDNIKAGKIVRGGSTLTQQVIRLVRKNRKRTYYEKLVELILATRLEWRYSKEEILSLYASHAPFGGNVVGIEAAAWRYFGQSPEQLSWAESAMLAVLPNSPGMIHTNKNRRLLKAKRDRLLGHLRQSGIIDSLTWQLSVAEPLPDKVHDLPSLAPHLLDKLVKTHPGKRIRTTLDKHLQERVNETVARHYRRLKANFIYNMGVIVVDVSTRKVIAYTGNTPTDRRHQKDVDVIDKPRSTGSILKPFLYTAMLDAGVITPRSLIPDIPTDISGYRPENYDLKYRGAVPAGEALRKSLNVPAVRMLRRYGVKKFYHQLQKLHLEHISKGAEHYGLSLILGGAEASLENLVRAYCALASTLNHYADTQGKYYDGEMTGLIYFNDENAGFGEKRKTYPLFNAGAIYTTMDVLRDVNRPAGEENWEFFEQSKNIAWKTGTSFGFRDAWAIGMTPQYVVGVWVGNADGEGRPGLTGHSSAAPVLFDVFDLLTQTGWFEIPYDEMSRVPLCRQSGHRPGKYCPEADTVYIPSSCLSAPACPYHKQVELDKKGLFRVNGDCADPSDIRKTSFFVLPPVQAFYYQKHHPGYRKIPPFRKDCMPADEPVMSFVGKPGYEKIYLPADFDETRNPVIFKVKHLYPQVSLFWYVDGKFYRKTQYFHELSLVLSPGLHRISITDEYGREIHKLVRVIQN